MASIKNGDLNFIFMIFIGLILAVALLVPSADQISLTTTDDSAVNTTYAMPISASTLELTGRNILNTPVVTNATGGEIITTGNYTIADGTGTDGLISIILTSDGGIYEGENVNISYTYQPDGSMSTSGSRSILRLVLIFGALAILGFAIVQLFKQESFAKLIKGKI